MTKKSLEVNGISLTYRVYGTGQTVLILHGWPSEGNRWHAVAENIAREGFEVVVPDLPGFGESSDPAQPWTSKNYVETIKQFMGELDMKRVIVFGHSFGGKIAALIAASHSKRVKQLILFAAAIQPSKKGFKYFATYIPAKIAKFILTILPIPPLKRLGNKIVARITGVPRFEGRDAMKQTLHSVVKEDVRSDLKKIKTPTLILWGTKDKVTPLSMGRTAKHAIADSTLVTLKDLDHRAHLTHPGKVAEVVTSYLDK